MPVGTTLDWTVVTNMFTALFPALFTDCLVAMVGVVLLCMIAAGAKKVFEILGDRVSGSSVGGSENYASSYQDQYQDSVAGARSGRLYVSREGLELRADGPGELMGASGSGGAVPYQTGDEVANSYVASSYDDQYADAAAGTGSGLMASGASRSSYNLSDVPSPAPARDGLTNA